MANTIKQIKLPDGKTYDLVDNSALSKTATDKQTVNSAVDFAGAIVANDSITLATNATLTLGAAPASNMSATTKQYVDEAIAGVSGGLVFKGTVGSGGTIEWSALPAAAAGNKGYMYKVITKHETAPVCEVGDLIISDGSSWIVIPSGDEPKGTVTSVSAGTGLQTADGNPITNSGTISINTSIVAQHNDAISGNAASATTGISLDAHNVSASFANGSVTPTGNNAESNVSFSGTLATASVVNSAGNAGTMAAVDVTAFSGGTPTAVTLPTFSQGSDSFTAAVYGDDSFTPASLGDGFYTAGSVTAGSVTNGSAANFSATVAEGTEILTIAWTADVPTAVTLPQITLPTVNVATFNGGAYSHSNFSGGSFTQGNDSWTAGSVTNGTAASLGAGFYTAGTAPTMPTFDSVANIVTSATTAKAAAQVFTGSASEVSGDVSVTVADHVITDSGHTHTVSGKID